jgi:hypothetical protein
MKESGGLVLNAHAVPFNFVKSEGYRRVEVNPASLINVTRVDVEFEPDGIVDGRESALVTTMGLVGVSDLSACGTRVDNHSPIGAIAGRDDAPGFACEATRESVALNKEPGAARNRVRTAEEKVQRFESWVPAHRKLNLIRKSETCGSDSSRRRADGSPSRVPQGR